MNSRQTLVRFAYATLALAAFLISDDGSLQAQAPAGATQTKLEIADGSQASYRAKEQLAGLSFPNDAVGTTQTITGTIVLAPDGSVDPGQSKLSVDLRTLKSDQDLRDGFIKGRTLEVAKYPMAEFVPRKLEGLPRPIPSPDRPSEQSGFQLTGDMTIHGVTKPVTFSGYATYSKDSVAGRAWTDITFADFGIEKPKLARVLSVDDKIQLELNFRMKRN